MNFVSLFIIFNAGAPPLNTGESSGSTAKTFNWGNFGFSTSATPVICPLVPMPVMM